jgi:hypothetical protein
MCLIICIIINKFIYYSLTLWFNNVLNISFCVVDFDVDFTGTSARVTLWLQEWFNSCLLEYLGFSHNHINMTF